MANLYGSNFLIKMSDEPRVLKTTITLVWGAHGAAPEGETRPQEKAEVAPPRTTEERRDTPVAESVKPEPEPPAVEGMRPSLTDSERRANRERAVQTRTPRPDGKLRITDVFVLRFLCEDARRHRSDVTSPLTNREVAAGCDIGHRTAQISLRRLAMQGLIEPFMHESGSHEGRCFRVSAEAFHRLAPRSVA